MATRARQAIAPPPAPPIQTGEDGRPIVPPPIVESVIERLAPDQNTVSDSGTSTTLDVFPDNRDPHAAWIYSIAHSVENSVYARSPLASPASLMAYTMLMYTGMMFYCDAYLRPVPSAFAAAILNDQNQLLLFQQLIDLHVPQFAHSTFEALCPHFDDLATNLMYFGSFASASLNHDFGRLIPITMYTELHNLLAVLPTNTSYPTLAYAYYTSVIATMTLGTTNVSITPAHLCAALYTDNNNERRYHNWFERSIDSLITANAIRVVNATATVTRLFFHAPANYTNAAGEFNPYLFAIGYNFDNREAILHLARNMNDFTHHVFSQSKPLRAYTQFGSQEIVRHLSFDSVLPTWHTLPVPANSQSPTDAQKNLFNGVTAPRTSTQFAATISFLVDRPAPAVTNTPAAIPLVAGEQPAAPNDQDGMAQLVLADPANPPATPGPYVRLFNVQNHVSARALIFDPSSSSRAHLAAVMISGKKIEVNDISMIGLPTPHVLRPLGRMNSQHILGAIPFSKIANSGSQSATIVRRRDWSANYRVAQAFFQGLPQQVILPLFRPGLVQPTSTATPPGNVIAAFLPGVSFGSQAQHAADGINVFSSQLGSTHATIPDGHFRIWSSYRHYDTESRTWYMLPTIRHIYGTRARFFGTEHLAIRLH
uniref:Capsid protein n=1 Tax=Rosellinia necatrix partitivirus 11 TaxID=2699379 RepID=A0A6F8QGT3_9VIRU|nr:capsid protein [Rosellinia necatrix partitivirus 11]